MGFKQERKRGQASFEAVQRKHNHEHLMRATERGRQSIELRESARRKALQGEPDLAHLEYLEAARLFDEADDSPAAAACWYDLAESFTKITHGVDHENFMEAEEYVRRALRSKARRADPLRHAMTLDLLGRCLRRLANGSNGQDEDREREARQAYERAVEIALVCGFVGEIDAAGYLHNLGNLLGQQGDHRGALAHHERSVALVEEAHRWIDQQGPKFSWLKLSEAKVLLHRLSLAQSLHTRGRVGDRAEIKRLVRQVIDGAPVKSELHYAAPLFLAGCLYDWGEIEEARRQISAVDVQRADFRARLGVLIHLDRLGENDRVLALAEQFADEAISKRHTIVADHKADHLAVEAQVFVALGARALVAADRAGEAFLRLEKVAALRFLESTSLHAVDLRDPVLRELTRLRAEVSRRGGLLDDAASRLAHLPAEPMKELLQTILEAFREHDPGLEIEALLRSPTPLSDMREIAAAAGQRSAVLVTAIQRRQWEMGVRRTANGDPSRADLEAILDEDPTRVLLRIRLEAPGVAVAVWRDDEGTQATGVPLELDEGLLRSIRDEAERDHVPTALGQALAALDDILPKDSINRHLVILPSSLAARVPWPAVATPAGRLLDRFAAFSQMPNLTPLRQRQAPRRARSGSVAVSPGTWAKPPTVGHELAFRSRSGMHLVRDGHATLAATLGAARHADVVAFYTHGEHAEEKVELQLADGPLVRDLADPDVWIGCERVEVWACSSGVNRPIDWLTPAVDEGFGLDMILHEAGVRSTIGTLWPVPDLPTSLIAWQFGVRLEAGDPPPRALAEAQRWWVHTLVPSLRECSTEEALRARLASMAMLSGAAQPPTDSVASILAKLEAPSTWAGFRFVGVADRRPEGDPVEAPITPEVLARVDVLLEEASAIKGVPLARPILEERRRAGLETFDPATALEVARLYGATHRGSRLHTLLRALAWIGEGLACNPPAELHRGLTLEAAWIALELGAGEWPMGLRRQNLPHEHWLDRALAITSTLPSDPEALCIAAMTRAHRQRNAKALETLWHAEILGHLKAASLSALARTRIVLFAADLVLIGEEIPEVWHHLILSTSGDEPASDPLLAALQSELAVRRMAMADRKGHAWHEEYTDRTLSDVGIAVSISEAWRQARRTSAAEPQAMEILSDELSILESRYWGPTTATQAHILATTGCPGDAWFSIVGGYLSSKVTEHPDRDVQHLMGNLCLGADLRVPILNAVARISAWLPDGERPQLELTAELMGVWEDAVIGGLRGGSDPHRRSVEGLTVPNEPPTAWPLQALLRTWPELRRDRTAAFTAERVRTLLEQSPPRLDKEAEEKLAFEAQAAGQWSLLAALQPVRSFEQVTQYLHAMPPEAVVVSLALGGRGEFILMSHRMGPSGAVHRTFASEVGEGMGLLMALEALHRVGPDEVVGKAPKRDRPEAWLKIAKILEPGLTHVLGDNPREVTQLVVLAPGRWRALPWGGLLAGGEPLYQRFESIALLPALGFAGPMATESRGPVATIAGPRSALAAQLLPAITAREGGIELPADPHRPRDIGEVDVLETRPDWRVVRFFGERSHACWVPSTSGFELTGDRAFMPRNLGNTRLAYCEAFEIWACTTPWGYSGQILLDGRDHLPGLVSAALQTGACGVLDLAWPVPELTRSLCLAVWSTLRSAELGWPPGPALVGVCHMMRDLLEQAVAALAVSREAACLVIEEHLKALGFGELEVDFTGLDEAHLRDALDFGHLAALRWWGWP